MREENPAQTLPIRRIRRDVVLLSLFRTGSSVDLLYTMLHPVLNRDE